MRPAGGDWPGSWRRHLDVARSGDVHMEAGAGDVLHVGIGRPGALLDLQPTPLGLELIAPAVAMLEFHEQLARAMLAVDRRGGGHQHRQPQRWQDEPGEGARERLQALTARTRSAARSSALRARGLAVTSSAE